MSSTWESALTGLLPRYCSDPRQTFTWWSDIPFGLGSKCFTLCEARGKQQPSQLPACMKLMASVQLAFAAYLEMLL